MRAFVGAVSLLAVLVGPAAAAKYKASKQTWEGLYGPGYTPGTKTERKQSWERADGYTSITRVSEGAIGAEKPTGATHYRTQRADALEFTVIDRLKADGSGVREVSWHTTGGAWKFGKTEIQVAAGTRPPRANVTYLRQVKAEAEEAARKEHEATYGTSSRETKTLPGGVAYAIDRADRPGQYGPNFGPGHRVEVKQTWQGDRGYTSITRVKQGAKGAEAFASGSDYRTLKSGQVEFVVLDRIAADGSGVREVSWSNKSGTGPRFGHTTIPWQAGARPATPTVTELKKLRHEVDNAPPPPPTLSDYVRVAQMVSFPR